MSRSRTTPRACTAALLALVAASGCGVEDAGEADHYVEMKQVPFQGKWTEVTGIADQVPWSDTTEFPPGLTRPLFTLTGRLTQGGLLSCSDVSKEGEFPRRSCGYYRRSFDPAAGPTVEYVGESSDQIAAVHDLDGDGEEDWITWGPPIQWGGWEGATTSLPDSGREQLTIFQPDGDGRAWIAAKAFCDPDRRMRIYRQKAPGGREFEDLSSLIPGDQPINPQQVTSHCLPGGDCYLAVLGWGCLGPDAHGVFRRRAGEQKWELHEPPQIYDMTHNAPMAAAWEERADGATYVYVTAAPQHHLFRVHPDGAWEPLPIPWAFVKSATGEDQIGWGIHALEIDGRPTVCMAHGLDDPYNPIIRRIGSSTINCYAREADDRWVELVDPVLNRTGGQPGVDAAKQLWGQFRYVDVRKDDDGRIWMAVDVLAGFGDRHARFLVYSPEP